MKTTIAIICISKSTPNAVLTELLASPACRLFAATITKLGDKKIILIILRITALKPRPVDLPAEKNARTPDNPVKNTPAIGVIIANIASTKDDMPNACNADSVKVEMKGLIV